MGDTTRAVGESTTPSSPPLGKPLQPLSAQHLPRRLYTSVKERDAADDDREALRRLRCGGTAPADDLVLQAVPRRDVVRERLVVLLPAVRGQERRRHALALCREGHARPAL